MAQTTEKPATTVDASRGGVTISSGVNSLTIGVRAQFRWTLDAREDANADSVNRARSALSGIKRLDAPNIAALSVALRTLRSVIRVGASS